MPFAKGYKAPGIITAYQALYCVLNPESLNPLFLILIFF